MDDPNNYAFEEGSQIVWQDSVFSEIAILWTQAPRFWVIATGELHFKNFQKSHFLINLFENLTDYAQELWLRK